MIIDFNWIEQQGVRDVINMIYKLLEIIRFIVPIALIVMTSIDITKKVINPEDKEGQKKIMIRAIAAVIVFFVPTIINIFLNIANIKKVDINDVPKRTSTPTPLKTPKPTVIPTVKPTIKPTYSPTPTQVPLLTVTCNKGTYLPAYANTCESCIANFYCPGGTNKTGESVPLGLIYCGNGYTSPPGSDDISDCKINKTPTPTATQNIIKCDAPTNVTISTSSLGAGTVKWVGTNNATDYEISINNSNWIIAYSGYNFKKVIIGNSGIRTVYVRSVCGDVTSPSASASVNVYSVDVSMGTGIDFVNGSGNYIEGETATISANVQNGYKWSYWISYTNNVISQQNYSFTVNGNVSFKAFAQK